MGQKIGVVNFIDPILVIWGPNILGYVKDLKWSFLGSKIANKVHNLLTFLYASKALKWHENHLNWSTFEEVMPPTS